MSKSKEEERKNVEKKSKVQIMDFLVPIISGFIFLILLFALIIPTIQDIRDSFDEIERLQQEQEETKRKINDLNEMDRITLREDFIDAREVVPYSLEVAEYAYYVDELAQEKELKFEEMRAQDQFSPGLGDIQNIQAVDAPLEYAGTFESVTEFFDRLQVHSPYIISMGDIEFERRATLEEVEGEEDTIYDEHFEEEEDDIWDFEITVTGYYAPEQDMPLNVRELTDPPFTPYYAGNEEIMEIFRDKTEVFEDPETDMVRPELEEELEDVEQEE